MMKKTFIACISALALVLALTSANNRKPVIHMIGDSTMANKSIKGNNIERGWGMLLSSYVQPEIAISNHAINGRSTKSFIDEGSWQKVLDCMLPGDYLFIQFGHNDEKINSPERYTKASETFSQNLRKFVIEARAKGAIPVLFNSIVRRNFSENLNAVTDDDKHGVGTIANIEGNELIETHIIKRSDGSIDNYLEAVKNVATELCVPFVDMNAISKQLVENKGVEQSKDLFCWAKAGEIEVYPEGRQDNTHLSIKGAQMLCAAAIDKIANAVPSLRPYIQSEPMSVRMVRSELKRLPQAMYIDFQTTLKWNYTQGLELQSMIMTANQYEDIRTDVNKFVQQYLDTVINESGKIFKYKTSNFSLDHINAGKMLFLAYDNDPQTRYKTAMDSLYFQLQHHPRTSEGGFWHKKIYPHQMWLDGIYMASPYYAEYAKRFLQGEEQMSAYSDVVKQFTLIAKHTYDAQNGLYRHAWDESCEQQWCDKATGQAPHVWGRALGWYTMAMVDVLDILPANYQGRDSLIAILQPLCEVIRTLQDNEYGAWYQVLDQGQRNGNYLEASCTAMFAYTFMKGAIKGYLPKEYYNFGIKAYDGLNTHFVREDSDGTISLTRCCGVAGLGGTPYRSGTFDYYVNEIIRDNDPKGVGPYIMASLLLENYGREWK